jgi:hypothetical protein
MESKGCKRCATTTEVEIEEKRLKSNAERTIKQNKAAENGKNIAYNYTVTCIMCASVIYYARYLNCVIILSSGIRSPMAIGWLFLEHSQSTQAVACYLKHW